MTKNYLGEVTTTEIFLENGKTAVIYCLHIQDVCTRYCQPLLYIEIYCNAQQRHLRVSSTQ